MKKSWLDFLKKQGAHLKKHSLGETLLDHLIGTYNLLDSWKLPKHVSVAGLFHSIYGNEYFKEGLLDFSERKLVVDVIGEEAEVLVYYFNACHRNQTLKNAREQFTQVTEVSTQQSHLLSKEQFAHLIFIIFANALEQIPEFHKLKDSEKGYLNNLYHTSKPYLNRHAIHYFEADVLKVNSATVVSSK